MLLHISFFPSRENDNRWLNYCKSETFEGSWKRPVDTIQLPEMGNGDGKYMQNPSGMHCMLLLKAVMSWKSYKRIGFK